MVHNPVQPALPALPDLCPSKSSCLLHCLWVFSSVSQVLSYRNLPTWVCNQPCGHILVFLLLLPRDIQAPGFDPIDSTAFLTLKPPQLMKHLHTDRVCLTAALQGENQDPKRVSDEPWGPPPGAFLTAAPSKSFPLSLPGCHL